MQKCLSIIGLCALLTACSSSSDKSQAKSTQAQEAPAPSKNPAAKYLELVGVRTREKGPGKLDVTFGVVNHSEADLGDLTLLINLRTTTAKPGDAPLCTFEAKVPNIGPQEMKEVTAIVPTKLRAYELPDWQFLRTDFTVVEPK